MKNNSERLSDILSWLDSISYIKTEKIPEVDLYMDQVTSFVDEHLKDQAQPGGQGSYQDHDQQLRQEPSAPRSCPQKYSKEHILLLLFIYYYKNLLSIGDIEQLFRPVTEAHFNAEDGLNLSGIYEEVFSRKLCRWKT